MRPRRFMEISQEIDRVFRCEDEDGDENVAFPTITPKALFFDTEELRLLTGLDHMMNQGWSESFLLDAAEADGFTDALYRELAGNSYSGIVFILFLVAFLIHVDLVKDAGRSDVVHDLSEIDELLQF